MSGIEAMYLLFRCKSCFEVLVLTETGCKIFQETFGNFLLSAEKTALDGFKFAVLTKTVPELNGQVTLLKVITSSKQHDPGEEANKSISEVILSKQCLSIFLHSTT